MSEDWRALLAQGAGDFDHIVVASGGGPFKGPAHVTPWPLVEEEDVD